MDTLGAMMDPTLTRLLDVRAELDDDVLRTCYHLDRADDSPLEQALFAWRDAGAPRPPVPALPKVGDLVTPENVALLPIGTTVEWSLSDGLTYRADRVGPDDWRGECVECDDEEMTRPEPPARIVSLPSASAPPKAGDRVTVSSRGPIVQHHEIASLPVGAEIEWEHNGTTWTAKHIRKGWWSRSIGLTEEGVGWISRELRIRVRTLPPTAEEARPTPSGCAGCTFDADDGWTCAIPLDHPKNTAAMAWIGSFGQGACPAHTPRNPPGCGVGGEVSK
jgi:hypothetical protein